MKLFLRKSGMFLTTLIITNLILIGVAFGQRFAVTSGNWDGPIWATTAGGVAGSAATPTAANAVTINVGVTVTMNVAGNCAGLTLSGGALSASVIDGTSLLTIGGNITVNNAATGSNGAIISCPLALGNTNRTITVANDGTTAVDFTISGVISSGTNVGFTKAGTGTLLLSGNNTHTGITTIGAGTLQLGSAGDGTSTPLGTIAAATSVSAGATLDLNGFTLSTAESLTLNGTGIAAGGSLSNSSVTSADYGGLITLASSSSIIANAGDINIINSTDITGNAFRLTIGGTGNGTISRNLNTTSGLTKIGTGTWTVSGNSSYTGSTLINAGTFKLGSAGDGTNTPLGTTTGRTTVSAGAVLDLNGITLSTAELLALNGTGISNGGALTNSSATAVDYSGLLSLGSSSSIIADAGSINLTNTGSISGNSLALTLGGSGNGSVLSVIGTGTAGSVTKIGTGTWTFLGTNTYRGATTITTGILKIGTGTNISSQSAVIVDAVLDLGGASEGIGSLAGTGTVTSSVAGDIILSAGFNNTSTSFSGIIEDGAATSVGLTKAGTGTLTLASNNTYTGVTTVAGGRLQLGAAGDGTNTPLGTIAGGTSVSSGATLDLNGFTLSTDESLILNGSGITGGGALSNSSATAVDYNGLITLGSASRIAADAGDIYITGTSDITGNTFRLTLAGSGNGSITRNINNTTGGLTKTGTGTWTVSGNSAYTASTIVNGGTLKLGSAGDGTNTPLGTIAGRTTVNAGGTLDLNGITISTNEPLTINGIGAAGDGALINSSVTHVNYNSAITLGSASIVGTTGDISLGAAGFIGGQDLTKVGTASLNLGTGTSNVGALLISDGAINSTTGILNVARDFTNNSIFNNNNGTVRFNGTLAQIIGGTTFTTFNGLTVANAAGVSLNAVDATVNGILTLTTGSLSIAGNTLTLNGTVTGAGTLTGSTTSNLTIGGAGAFGTLFFDQTTNPVTNGVANLVINRTPGGTVTLGSTFNVLTAATFTAGIVNTGTSILRLGGTVSTAGGTVTASGTGMVTFNGTTAQSIPPGLFTSNTASNITISNASGVTFNGSVAVSGNFTVNANSIFTPTPAVVISGTGTLLGNNSNNSIAQVTRATGISDLTGQYTLNRNLTNLVIEYAGASAQGIEAGTAFGGLKISNSNGVNMAGNVTVGNGLNLNTGNLSIAGNTLTLNGAVSRTSGNLAGSDISNLTVGGTAGLLYFDGAGTNNFLKNFTVNTAASATLGNTLNITGGASAGNEGTLAVNGTGVLTTGGFLTIKSNVNGTARIAAGNAAGGYISGDVTVERFIPQNASKAWRLLASNTSGQTINQAWQEGAIGPLANPNPGFGTMIPGLFSTVAQAQAAGFDTLSQAPSILKYEAATDNLIGVPNTNATLLSSEQGYFIFIRGDRSPYQFGANNVASTSTTLRSKGSIFQGDQSPATVINGLYALLRNPYASALDLRNVTIGGGLVDAFQVWDPKLAGSFGLGAYQTFTKVGANYEVTPGGGSYPASGSVVNTIESGAAFFAQATGADGTVQINESSKTSGSSLVFRPSGTLSQDSRIITNLYVDNGSSTILADGNMVLFAAAYSNVFDVNDVKKNTNTGENFGLLRTGINLVVEKRQLPVSTDTVLFYMSGLKKINYKLEIRAENINVAAMEAFLEDSYKGTQTALSLNDITTYSFAVDANAASSVGTRFKIVFRPFTALPVTFTDIKAVQVNNNIALEWKVSNQLNIAKYEIEKSIDGRNFSKAASQEAQQLSTGSITYNWLDENTITGVNYYRIKAIEISGNAKYTEIVKVLIGKGGTGITLSPNVIRGSLVNLQFNNQAAGRYGIRLLNINGQLVYKNQVLHTGGNASQSLNLPSAVAKGIYQLQVIAPDNSISVQKLIIDRN